MFYEKDIQTLKVNKIVKYNIADASSKEEFQVTDNDPNMVVQKYNEFKLLYHDKEPEILCKNNDNLFEGINNSYHGNRGNNDNNGNNHSYYSNGNNDNNNNNESQNQGLISSGIMRNGNNRQIGSVDRDGVVRDSCNREIGRAEGISKEQAAFMYFFK